MGARALSRLAPGERVAGRYQVVGHVGSGGMGDVYEVEHTLLGRRFALKRLAPDLTADAAMVERFLREARAAAATHHPGVVEVIDLGFAEAGWPFLVMEKLTGETVRDRLRRGPVPEGAAAQIAAQVLDALAAAHAVGVVHRDIKPENLWLCAGPALRVKVLDFGLALLVSGDRTDLRLTQSGAVMGTPLYMSPEQARGHEVDGRTDLYSLGAVLYEMVTGRPPFHAEAYSVLVAMILEDAPPTEPLMTASAGMRMVLDRALTKRRDDRFPDAAAMRAAIAALAATAGAAGVGAVAGADTGVATRNAERVITGAATLAVRPPAGPLLDTVPSAPASAVVAASGAARAGAGGAAGLAGAAAPAGNDTVPSAPARIVTAVATAPTIAPTSGELRAAARAGEPTSPAVAAADAATGPLAAPPGVPTSGAASEGRTSDAAAAAARVEAPSGPRTSASSDDAAAADTSSGSRTNDAAPARADASRSSEPRTSGSAPLSESRVATAPVVAAPRVRGPWLLAGLIAITAIAVAIAIAATRRATAPSPAGAAGEPLAAGGGSGAAAGERAPWRVALARGDLGRAVEEGRRAALRSPDDLGLAARALVLELVGDRPGAYERLARLGERTDPPVLAAAIAAAAATKRGDPAAGADALAAPLATVPAGSVDELLFRLARATLYRLGDRFPAARAEYEAILARRPAFAPAIEPLLERLCWLGDDADLAAARAVLDAYTAAAPDSPDLELRAAELSIAERRYRDALDRLDQVHAAGPQRDQEIDELRGALHLLLGDVDGAIAAYDPVDDPQRRAEYIAGALLHAGRADEAAAMYRDAIARFPAAGKPSRLAKLVIDAAFLALVRGDRALADVAAAGIRPGATEAPAASARAFARAVVTRLAGGAPTPDDFPLGDASPAFVLARAWGAAAAHADELRRATDPANVHVGVVATHVYPPLELLRAQAEAAAGHDADALPWLDRVLRPPHYDPTRGAVLVDAMRLRVQVLERLGRRGEAQAAQKELDKLGQASGSPSQ